MGVSSTHRGDTGVTPRTGVDTLRELFEVDRQPGEDGGRPGRFEVELGGEAWVVDPLPALGMLAVEGNPANGELWSPDDVVERGERLRGFVGDHFGLRLEAGVSRLDVTTSRPFASAEGKAFLTGVAALDLPRLEGTRRPATGVPRSVWWTGARTAAIKNRAYCESFKVEGREPWSQIRLEDQRRFGAGKRPSVEMAADPELQRGLFERRWEPMRKALTGVKAASLPVLATSLADEVRLGYRPWREAERLAGALVLLSGGLRAAELGGARSSGGRALYRRRAELREAGYVVVDDVMEPVEVDLGGELERALEEFGS